MGRRGEKELICALHAIDTEFLARTVIRADKGPIDFVTHGNLEFLGEIGRKRIVIRSDKELAVKALVQAVALHRQDNRCCVGRDGYTAFQRFQGRIYNGEVCDLFECVLFKVPSPWEAKQDDRFRLGVWIGKTSTDDDHLIFDCDEVRKCRTVKRRPEYLRWDRGRVDAIGAHPQRPRPSRERVPRDRPKRYTTWANIKKYTQLQGLRG